MHRTPFRELRGSLPRPQRGRLPANRRLPAIYRLGAEAGDGAPAGELARDPALALIEAALVAADEPLTPRRLGKVAGIDEPAEVRRLVRKLQGLYDRDASAFQVQELAGGYQLLTRPEYHSWLTRLKRTGNELRLSPAMRETLAIVAYRQPIMRADIEKVRGVHCGELLRQLMEKGLIRIAGRDTSLGRPVLYGTSRKFLQVYGLKSLKDLPQVEALRPPPKSAADAGPAPAGSGVDDSLANE
jgi:segregation and condensation protein B